MRLIVSGINSITYHLARHLIDLMKLLDLEEKCGVVYKCKFKECGQFYVGEMERS